MSKLEELEEILVPQNQKGEWREIGAALILSAFTWGYIGILYFIQPLVENKELLYVMNKSRTTAILGWILSWAAIFLNSVSPTDLFDLETGNGQAKAILLVGLFYCITTAWVYG